MQRQVTHKKAKLHVKCPPPGSSSGASTLINLPAVPLRALTQTTQTASQSHDCTLQPE